MSIHNRNIKSFQEFKISQDIINSLSLLNMTEPTPVQSAVIPHILQRNNIIAKSQTGSGKTAAFGIPLCELVTWDYRAPQVLVLEPTRELTVQVKEELYYIGRTKRLKIADVFGGFPIDKQLQTLRQKNHMVVGTPGRVGDHIRRGSLKLESIRHLVIDEADLMLDMGFSDEVKQIMDLLPNDISIYLFSATMTSKVTELISYMKQDAITLEIKTETETVETIVQKLYSVGMEEKYLAFLDSLTYENPDSAIIFCGTRDMVEVLGHKLSRDGVKSAVLHGEIDQSDRIKAIQGFKSGKFRYLIATDVASRGVDIPKLSHVFNFDFPTNKEVYVHRIGRTGRNGEAGTAISFITAQDKNMLSAVSEYIGIPLTCMELPIIDAATKSSFIEKCKTPPPRRAHKAAAFNKTISKIAIGGGKKSKMRTIDIVGCICNIEHISAEDIGAIDIRDSITYVEILNGKCDQVLKALQTKPIKGKIRNVRKGR